MSIEDFEFEQKKGKDLFKQILNSSKPSSKNISLALTRSSKPEDN
jgi:hypothetical protein